MILDKYENKDLYVGIHPKFAKCFEYVEEYMKNPVPAGTYEIEGRDLYVMVQDSETRLEGFLETHKKYIDVQVLISGEEMVYCDWGYGLETETPYNEEKDFEFFKDREDKIEFVFAGGEFMILFPHDAHKPAMIYGDKQTVCKKLVFKVKI